MTPMKTASMKPAKAAMFALTFTAAATHRLPRDGPAARKEKATAPNRSTSPFLISLELRTRRPFTKVPLVESRSFTFHRPRRCAKIACRAIAVIDGDQLGRALLHSSFDPLFVFDSVHPSN